MLKVPIIFSNDLFSHNYFIFFSVLTLKYLIPSWELYFILVVTQKKEPYYHKYICLKQNKLLWHLASKIEIDKKKMGFSIYNSKKKKKIKMIKMNNSLLMFSIQIYIFMG